MIKEIDATVSKNFQVLKLASILIVMLGHFFYEIKILWVPATIGLFIFSFSSGYFTEMKYYGNLDKNIFWKKKIERLGFNLLLIDIFLFLLFLIQNREGLWTWQTVINLLGLNGFLNWLHIPNPSPFGRGMWFFTLLLIFYACYPLLNRIDKKKMLPLTVAFVVIAYILNRNFRYGHALWLTACGFVTGIQFAKNDFRISKVYSAAAATFSFALMIFFNHFLKIDFLNFPLMIFFTVFFICAVIELRLPGFVYMATSFFSGCILEIYLLHPYSWLETNAPIYVNSFATLVLILWVSKLLNVINIFIKSSTKKVFV